MTMPIDVSVVVPVYNTELYLRQCIDSLINQTLKNVEFIFVDDGSTDHSVEIIEEYREKDSRIQLIKQENQYAGVARNNGMKVATGKYIIFLDSDDFFELNMLEEAFNCAEKNQADITIFGYNIFDNQTNKVKRSVLTPPQVEGVFSFSSFEKSGTNTASDNMYLYIYIDAPWNKFFLKSFLEENRLQFQTLRKCNDTFFTHMSCYLARSIVYLQKNYVYYRDNNKVSLQGNADLDREGFITFELAIKRELVKRNLFFGIYKRTFYYHLLDMIKLFGTLRGTNIDSLREYFNAIKNNLVPALFDSEKEFEHDKWVTDVYHCENFEAFLFYQMHYFQEENAGNKAEILKIKKIINNDTVSKKSKDYLIGHAALVIPRKIKNYWRK